MCADEIRNNVQTIAVNYAALLKRLNYLLENGYGASASEIADLAVKADGVSFALQRLLDVLWPNEAHATKFR